MYGRAYIHCCDCESTNLSFGLCSLTTGDVFSFQSFIMILSLVNHWTPNEIHLYKQYTRFNVEQRQLQTETDIKTQHKHYKSRHWVWNHICAKNSDLSQKPGTYKPVFLTACLVPSTASDRWNHSPFTENCTGTYFKISRYALTTASMSTTTTGQESSTCWSLTILRRRRTYDLMLNQWLNPWSQLSQV